MRALILLIASAFALPWQAPEERPFHDPEGRYQLVLRDRWEPVTYQDGAGNTVTDIVYGSSEEGLLRIRQFKVEPGISPRAFIEREEEVSLRFRPGYLRGAIESFGGVYPESVVFNFEFTRRGQKKVARYYVFKTDETTIYLLQFEGRPNVIRSTRNRLDLIARSFRARS
ncbi:hypothetical protein HRbin10_02187 [bacterium HR10]|nr:hypothetical protein HRbin10_02187 [bacterium HR10]